jgi:exopolysaccharide biosynthesis protein
VEGSYGWGLQPRSAIGQTKNGDFLMLIVDGRQVGYSIGCLVEDSAKILKKHRAFQAVNMDGGSSSIMAYQGKIITKNSSKSELGREIPNSLVVTHSQAGNRHGGGEEENAPPEENDSEETEN